MWMWTLSLALADPSPDFLVGCWQTAPDAAFQSRETWLGPVKGTLVGALLGTLPDGSATWEHLRIEPTADSLQLVVLPKGQAETRFPLAEHGEGRLVFALPTHDFPQRIRYERVGTALKVVADAQRDDGTWKGVELSYTRCEG